MNKKFFLEFTINNIFVCDVIHSSKNKDRPQKNEAAKKEQQAYIQRQIITPTYRQSNEQLTQ